MKSHWLLIAAALVGLNLASSLNAQTPNTNAASLSAGLVRGFPDRTVPVPLTLRHTGSVSAVQFDLSYPSSTLMAGTFQAATTQSNAVIRSRKVSPNTFRVLAYSQNVGLLRTNSSLGQLPFTVPAGMVTGGGRIVLSNALAASRAATAVTPLGLNHGSVQVSQVFLNPDGAVDLLFNVESNRTYVIQVSEDLIHWTNLSTNFATLDYIIITDTDAPMHSLRFYRAVPWEPSPGGEIGSVQLLLGGLFTFSYPTAPGRSYVLQASTNLILWEDLTTNLASENVLAFTNFISPTFEQRFYRVRE